MTTLWSDLYPTRFLLSQTYYSLPGTTIVTAPYDASILRVSAVGAGGWLSGGYGTGGDFARTKLEIGALAQFEIQVGDIAHSLGAGDALGDSVVTRVSDGAVILRAGRGGATPGPAGNSVGDVVRGGLAATGSGAAARGGSAAGDDQDLIALGFGGRGGALVLGPVRGGGGCQGVTVSPPNGSPFSFTAPPGLGLVCVEFFIQDPGY